MSLEEAIKHLEEELEIKEDWSCVACKEDHQQLLEWLKELQSIKSVEPSEALKWLERYRIHIMFNTDVVENALLKAQKQEKENEILKGQMKYLTEIITDFQKVLKIVFEKNVQVNNLKKCKTLEEYNILWTTDELTQEEFDTLKEWD